MQYKALPTVMKKQRELSSLPPFAFLCRVSCRLRVQGTFSCGWGGMLLHLNNYLNSHCQLTEIEVQREDHCRIIHLEWGEREGKHSHLGSFETDWTLQGLREEKSMGKRGASVGMFTLLAFCLLVLQFKMEICQQIWKVLHVSLSTVRKNKHLPTNALQVYQKRGYKCEIPPHVKPSIYPVTFRRRQPTLLDFETVVWHQRTLTWRDVLSTSERVRKGHRARDTRLCSQGWRVLQLSLEKEGFLTHLRYHWRSRDCSMALPHEDSWAWQPHVAIPLFWTWLGPQARLRPVYNNQALRAAGT